MAQKMNFLRSKLTNYTHIKKSNGNDTSRAVKNMSSFNAGLIYNCHNVIWILYKWAVYKIMSQNTASEKHQGLRALLKGYLTGRISIMASFTTPKATPLVWRFLEKFVSKDLKKKNLNKKGKIEFLHFSYQQVPKLSHGELSGFIHEMWGCLRRTAGPCFIIKNLKLCVKQTHTG